jgi:hypothetical protein
MTDVLNHNLKIDVANLITFFDEAPLSSRGHATAIASIVGEDLGAGIFKYFLESNDNSKVTILIERPTSGKKKSNRLDKWIEVVNQDGSGCYYQAEIKGWSAHAIHGEVLPIAATRAQERLHKIKQWETIWNKEINRPKWDSVEKVLAQMRNPAGFNVKYPLYPLLIFWDMLHPLGAENFFFEQTIGKTGAVDTVFKSIWIFSISAYLRSLHKKVIEVYMPDTVARLKWLSEIFSVDA